MLLTRPSYLELHHSGDLARRARETLALRYALYDLDGKTKRAIALDDLVWAVKLGTIRHPEDCGCGLCRAIEAVGG